MASTIAGAKTDLYNLLATDTDGTPKTALAASVTKVYSYEPLHSNAYSGTPITLATGPTSTEEFSIVLRIYQVIRDAKVAQDNLDTATWAVEGALAASAEFYRSDWSAPAYDENIGALVVQTTVSCGRSDF